MRAQCGEEVCERLDVRASITGFVAAPRGDREEHNIEAIAATQPPLRGSGFGEVDGVAGKGGVPANASPQCAHRSARCVEAPTDLGTEVSAAGDEDLSQRTFRRSRG